MTKLIHSLPWTLALTLAAQANEGEAIRVPVSGGSAQECQLDSGAARDEAPDEVSDSMLFDRIKKSLEM